MLNLDPYQVKARTIAAKVQTGDWDPQDVAQFYLRRVENLHRELNTHIQWDMDTASRAVEHQLDYIAAALKAGKTLPLAGVPIAVKDNILLKGSGASCGSQMLANFRSPYDATVVERLRAAGALFLGKTNLDEFAMGSSNENSAFGPVLNPWNIKRVSGGSSGGSAATVAAAMVPLSLGSDTGGSIRQPASFCGVVGLKPSYGRVSRYGLVAYASSFDQIGPFARNIEDAALLYDVIAGHDPRDSTSVDTATNSALTAIDQAQNLPSLKGLKVGLVKEFMTAEGVEPAVQSALDQACKDLEALGAEIRTVSLPSVSYGVAAYYLLATAEASSNLARYDGIRYGYRSQSASGNLKDLYFASRSEGFGREVKQRIMLGTFALSSGYYDAYYEKASKVRLLMRQEMDQALKEVDVLLSPTAPTVAFELGSKLRDPLAMYLSDVFTIQANLGGHPALSIPCGYDQDNMPIGMQLIGPMWSEDRLLQYAYVYENEKRWGDEFKPRC
ncbi:MAG: Asp-tRNA(Asn)/Glu-tRNA(Gln) amidotransferase subunit GatA [Oligoflexus sp.]